MNKQEAIEELQKQARHHCGEIECYKDGCEKSAELSKAINIVSCIDESQKVVVPKFVAEWLKKYRYAHTLLKVLNAAEKEQITPSTVNDWILDNQYDFIKAWIDGYDVELEDGTDE